MITLTVNFLVNVLIRRRRSRRTTTKVTKLARHACKVGLLQTDREERFEFDRECRVSNSHTRQQNKKLKS